MKNNVVTNSFEQVKSCRKVLNVESATNYLDDAVAYMLEAVEALDAHLQPLLGSEHPIGCAEERIKGDSEVAERIMSNADAIRGRSDRIRMLIDRL
jgi:hypothetical protein